MYTTKMIPSGQSPRRELQLQGPRPTPLKLHQSSHKIRKPPVAPQAAPAHRRPPLAPPLPRSPVIIYAVSPKIIHTNPNEFMSLVQRLTGPNWYNSPSASSPAFGGDGGGAVSPAARFASIEKTKSPKLQKVFDRNTEALPGVEIETDRDVLMTGQFPGILSPNPNTLPQISPKFFPQPTPPENNSLSFFFDLSPVLHSNRNYNYLDNNFMLPSPSAAFMISPQINLPSPNTLDLFHSLFDL